MPVEYGSIHGRFQPFHNGHLRYAERALECCDILYVGITRVLTELGSGTNVAPHRFKDSSNPFYYRERLEIIESSLLKAGYPRDRFRIGPFPIENIDRLPEFWAKENTCFTTVVDDWNKSKIELLERAGYKVRSLKDGPWLGRSLESGTTIRRLIQSQNPEWLRYVPQGAIKPIQAVISSGRFSPQ